MTDVALVVIAKSPRPGASKTRLCPPCSPEEAAALAEAALRDTLDAVAAAPVRRRILVLEGDPGPWLPYGFEVFPQRGGGLDQRLASAFDDIGDPAFLVAMDTPQLTAGRLAGAVAALAVHDAAIGPTRDGGYWGIGFRRPCRAALEGVPMSSPSTFAAQAQRLRECGLTTARLGPLTDIDMIEDARAVARAAPWTRFARELRASGHATGHEQPVPEAAA